VELPEDGQSICDHGVQEEATIVIMVAPVPRPVEMRWWASIYVDRLECVYSDGSIEAFGESLEDAESHFSYNKQGWQVGDVLHTRFEIWDEDEDDDGRVRYESGVSSGTEVLEAMSPQGSVGLHGQRLEAVSQHFHIHGLGTMISFTVCGRETVVQTLSAAWQPNQLVAPGDVRTFVAPVGQMIVGLVFDQGVLVSVKTNQIDLEDNQQPAMPCAGVVDNPNHTANIHLNQDLDDPRTALEEKEEDMTEMKQVTASVGQQKNEDEFQRLHESQPP